MIPDAGVADRPPDRQRIAELAERFIVGAGELDGAGTLALFASDARFLCRIRSDSLPLQRDISGHSFCTELMAEMRAIFPAGVKQDVQSILVDGNYAIVESVGFGQSISGAIYNNNFCFVIKFKDYLITEVREYADFLHVKEAIFDNLA